MNQPNKEYGCDNCGIEERNLVLLADGREVCLECEEEIAIQQFADKYGLSIKMARELIFVDEEKKNENRNVQKEH